MNTDVSGGGCFVSVEIKILLKRQNSPARPWKTGKSDHTSNQKRKINSILGYNVSLLQSTSF